MEPIPEHIERCREADATDYEELMMYMKAKCVPAFRGELKPGYVLSREYVDDDSFMNSREAYVIALMLERLYPSERGQRQ